MMKGKGGFRAPFSSPKIRTMLHTSWHHVTTPLRKYAAIEGRAGRAEFWLFHLAVYTVLAAHCIMGTLAGAELRRIAGLSFTLDTDAMHPTFAMVWGVMFACLFLFTVIPMIAVSVRRLHDIGWTGHALWPYLLLGTAEWWGVVIHFGYWIAFALPGQARANTYGDVLEPLIANRAAC